MLGTGMSGIERHFYISIHFIQQNMLSRFFIKSMFTISTHNHELTEKLHIGFKHGKLQGYMFFFSTFKDEDMLNIT